MKNFDISKLTVVHANDTEYSRLFIINQDSLLKFNPNNCLFWEKLCLKKLDHANLPTEILELTKNEKEIYKLCNSKVVVPFLKGSVSLSEENFTRGYNSVNILNILKETLLILESYHKNGVFHGDIIPENIMINKDIDLNFIDFEAAIVDDVVPEFNTYYYDDITLDKKIDLNKYEDKMNVLTMFLNYLRFGKFTWNASEMKYYKNIIWSIGLPKDVNEELVSYVTDNRNLPRDYYFHDIIDYLVGQNYESPMIRIKNMTERD
ncbi:MAG: hypothetical protein RSA10_03055 [Bacilli bacterium]